MVTDHLLIRRAARELDRELGRLSVRDIGLADDGSYAILIGGGDRARTLRMSPFATPPLVWVSAPAELSLEAEPAWLRAAGAILLGRRLLTVRARRGDRVIRFEFEGRSRFGVADQSSLIVELVPRFGNVIVLRGDTIVAAAKTFSPAENPERSLEVGRRYEPPPLSAKASGRLPRLVEASLEVEAERLRIPADERAAWQASRAADFEAAADADTPVFAYRRDRDGEIVAAHVLPLLQFSELTCTHAPTLLDVFAEAAERGRAHASREGFERRRDELARSLTRRRRSVAEQLSGLDARERELSRRDDFRRAGETIYSYLAQIPEAASGFSPPDRPHDVVDLDPSLSAKENAARYFERYRKANSSAGHLVKRRAALERERDELDSLLWEVERADAEALREIATDLRSTKREAKPRAIRRILPHELPSGARVYVGRSPRENAEITFRIARPNDLWFHVRNAPGAHVVLQPVAGSEASADEIDAAARFAAQHSRAKDSAAVDVDYTARKFVRKQRDAAPGMVWYTNFKTIRVAPAQDAERRRT